MCIDRAIARQGFELIAFVYMPEHVHLIVYPVEQRARVENLLYGIKRPFSYRVKQQLRRANTTLLDRLTMRERPGKTTFRFWQEGPGYDRNIRTIETLRTAIDYLHHNPVRRGLCESPDGWKWSSWDFYFGRRGPIGSDLPTVHGFDG